MRAPEVTPAIVAMATEINAVARTDLHSIIRVVRVRMTPTRNQRVSARPLIPNKVAATRGFGSS